MLQVVARALCDRPGDSAAQGEGRTRQMVLSTLGMAPRDGLEFMLATLAFDHFQLILDSMRDVFRGQADALKVKTKTAIVPLGGAMLEMIRELRLAQVRPLMQAAEDSRTEAAAEVQPQQTAASLPAANDLPPPDPAVLSEEELATLADPRLGLPAQVIAWVAGTGPAVPLSARPGPEVPGTGATPLAPETPGDAAEGARLPFNAFAEAQRRTADCGNTDLAAWDDPNEPVAGYIVSHDDTLAAAYETPAQGCAESVAKKAASGD